MNALRVHSSASISLRFNNLSTKLKHIKHYYPFLYDKNFAPKNKPKN